MIFTFSFMSNKMESFFGIINAIGLLFLCSSPLGSSLPSEISSTQDRAAVNGTVNISPGSASPLFKSCAGLFQQVPIVIDPNTAVFVNYPKLNFSNYEHIIPDMTIVNNVQTVLLQLPPNYPIQQLPTIRGGGLPPDPYIFFQVHFHWGLDALQRVGSEEHVIGTQRYPAELHLVHYNAGRYRSPLEAAVAGNRGDGLVVLVVLIELQKRDSVAWRYLADPLSRVYLAPGQGMNLPSPFPLMDLLPDIVQDFYRYNGPLSTPGCQENVPWIVFDTPIAISERQLAEFWKLSSNPHPPIGIVQKPYLIPWTTSESGGNTGFPRVVTYKSESGGRLRRNRILSSVTPNITSHQNQDVHHRAIP